MPEETARIKLAAKIVEDGLSVREAENLARLYAAGQTERAPRPVAPKSFKAVARKLRRCWAPTSGCDRVRTRARSRSSSTAKRSSNGYSPCSQTGAAVE